MSGRTLVRFALLAALVAAIAAAYPYRNALDFAALERMVHGAGSSGPATFMAVYAIATVLSVPGAVLTLAAGALFGAAWGAFYSLTGATIGATAAFAIARYVASDWVARRTGKRTKQLIDGVESEGWRFVAFVRLVPLFPFNIVNYALGLTRIRLLDYVLASYLFMLPGAFAYSYLGYAGREALAGAEGTVQKSLAALALVAVIAFLPRIVRGWRTAKVVDSVDGTLTAAQLKARVDNGQEVLVVDVRTAADFAGPGGHVPGAMNIPVEDLPLRLQELEASRERPLALVCRTNRRSSEAVRLLKGSGYRNVLLVSDGMLAWERHGFPVEI